MLSLQERNNLSHKISEDIVIWQIKEIHPDIDIIGRYMSKASPLYVKCRKCGFEWNSTANRLIAGHGCRKCADDRKRHKRGYYRKTHEQFISELHDISPNILVCSEYKSATHLVECTCEKCGHKWSAKPANLLAGFGCPNCALVSISAKQIKPHSEFVDEMRQANPWIEVIGLYTGNKNNVSLKCLNCGCVWDAMPINLLRKDGKNTGCPKCKRSHGETQIANWLDQNHIMYKPWKTFDGLVGVGGELLSYDFFLPEYNMLIEFQGQYHDNTARLQTTDGYLIQLEHDRRKREYASKHHITLLEIWYYDRIEDKITQAFDNIKEPVTTTAS